MGDVSFKGRRDMLRARGYPCWESVTPELRESIAAGIAHDWERGRRV